MIQNEGRSDKSQHRLIDDDDGLDVAMAAPRGSNGDTPVSRRASPLISPTARFTRNPNSQESSAILLPYESLSRRPRSNPRTRTPMRYESPLNSNAFRREGLPPTEAPSRKGRRISVRPFAGAAVGSIQPARIITEEIHYARRSFVPGNSQKQRPSHRKIRRWNNDNFVGIALELAKSSSRGPAVAESLLIAQADAANYRAVYNPHDCQQSVISKLSEDAKLADVRDKFLNGEIGHGIAVQHPSRKKELEEASVTPAMMMNRIHRRLRGVVVRACCNSEFSMGVIDAFERFLVNCFAMGPTASLHLVDTLIEAPTITKLTTGQTLVRFYFDSTSSRGGFHRLLLHAVCQFHGLHAVSISVDLNQNSKSRLLTVTGNDLSSPNVRLVVLAAEIHEANPVAEVFQLASQINALKV